MEGYSPLLMLGHNEKRVLRYLSKNHERASVRHDAELLLAVNESKQRIKDIAAQHNTTEYAIESLAKAWRERGLSGLEKPFNLSDPHLDESEKERLVKKMLKTIVQAQVVGSTVKSKQRSAQGVKIEPRTRRHLQMLAKKHENSEVRKYANKILLLDEGAAQDSPVTLDDLEKTVLDHLAATHEDPLVRRNAQTLLLVDEDEDRIEEIAHEQQTTPLDVILLCRCWNDRGVAGLHNPSNHWEDKLTAEERTALLEELIRDVEHSTGRASEDGSPASSLLDAADRGVLQVLRDDHPDALIRQRAHIVLLLDQGMKGSSIAQELQIRTAQVYAVMREWGERGVPGLYPDKQAAKPLQQAAREISLSQANESFLAEVTQTHPDKGKRDGAWAILLLARGAKVKEVAQNLQMSEYLVTEARKGWLNLGGDFFRQTRVRKTSP